MSSFARMALALMIWATGSGAQEASGLARMIEGSFQDQRDGLVLDLELSQGVPWRLFTLTDPARVVVDFREVDFGGASEADLDQSALIEGLRMGPFRSGWSRLVAGLTEPLAIESAGMRTDAASGVARLRVEMSPTDAESFAQSAGAPAQPGWDRPVASELVPLERADSEFVIVLDPGHGGIDPGAERGDVNEARLMLQFARELRDVLVRAGLGRVELTREDDTFVSLEARVALAHDVGGDMFVSLHADSLDQGVAHGASVYTLAEEASDAASEALAERHERDDLLLGLDLTGADDEVTQVLLQMARQDNTPRSQALAVHLVGGIENALGHVHKQPLREAGFSVLKAADIPSVLIELGFLSSEEDLQNLQDPAWRAGMAAGIRDGIAAWALEDAALSRLRRQ